MARPTSLKPPPSPLERVIRASIQARETLDAVRARAPQARAAAERIRQTLPVVPRRRGA